MFIILFKEIYKIMTKCFVVSYFTEEKSKWDFLSE
jgi:hypothetical protein